MLGDIVRLANNLWLVVGNISVDIPNVLVYLAAHNRLYLIDSAAGSIMRRSIIRVLNEVGFTRSFTLLNSHGHTDHVGNNDLIHQAQAKEKYHFISEVGLRLLDSVTYFADQFYTISTYYDPTTGYQADRLRWQFRRVLTNVARLLVGEQKALKILFSIYLKRFEPYDPSIETIQTYESLPKQSLTIGGVLWTGWVMGDNNVWVLEARGHTPDEVLFYIPEHHLLYTGDLTFPLFPTFPSSNGQVIRDMLRRCQAMTYASAIRMLIDGHHHQVYQGQEEVVEFLGTLLSEHEHFQDVLREILEEKDGLTIGQLYAQVQRQRHDDQVIRHYLSLEFPYLPMALQQIITISLVQMGYEAKGPRRRKRFYQPTKA